MCAAKGHLGCLQYLISIMSRNNVLNQVTLDGLSILHYACAYDNVNIIKYLIDTYSDININTVSNVSCII
jgi:ankyrin repeat protein